MFGTVNVLGFTDAAAFPYTPKSHDVVATSATTIVSFSFRNDTDYWYLDDVSVKLSTVVPEPSSVLLLAAGLAGIAGFAARRRRD